MVFCVFKYCSQEQFSKAGTKEVEEWDPCVGDQSVDYGGG